MNRIIKLLADNRKHPGRAFSVRALAGNEAEILLYDAIVDTQDEADWLGGVSPQSMVPQIRDIKAGTIHLRINSPGGSVFAARAIEAALREHPARIVVHVDGVAASAASVVAMAGDEIVMQPGAMLMVHKSWTLTYGNANDLLETAALLEKVDGTLAETYATRSGKPRDEIDAWMAAETWFTGAEAVSAGLADRVAEAESKPAAAWNLSAYAHAPAAQQRVEDVAEPSDAVRVDADQLLRRLGAALLPA